MPLQCGRADGDCSLNRRGLFLERTTDAAVSDSLQLANVITVTGPVICQLVLIKSQSCRSEMRAEDV